jgi:type VI secretion system protein ImpC
VLDLDRFDAAFRQMAPALVIGAGDGHPAGLSIAFETLDDFHPDRLYARLEALRPLRESRARLQDPATRAQESARLMADGAQPSRVDVPSDEATVDDTLRRLIGVRPQPHAASAPGVVDALVRRLVEPHVVSDTAASVAPYVAALDASASDLMRAVLHDPDFQALEALWRGVRALVDTIDLDSGEVTLHIVDVSKDELLADLAATAGDAERSAAGRLLQAHFRNDEESPPRPVLVGAYTFDASTDDVALLGHLGVLASRVGGPMLAGATPRLVGCAALNEDTDPKRWAYDDPDVGQRWHELRRSPAARWLGLTVPRLLLRLPYGAKTDAIESFAFEEWSAAATHEHYLWGNAALACAGVVARAFGSDGDDASLEGPIDLDDLPAHVCDVDGERRLVPCAEVVLPLRIGEELRRRGLMPLLSYRNRNAARLMGLQSVADPPAGLAGLR